MTGTGEDEDLDCNRWPLKSNPIWKGWVICWNLGLPIFPWNFSRYERREVVYTYPIFTAIQQKLPLNKALPTWQRIKVSPLQYLSYLRFDTMLAVLLFLHFIIYSMIFSEAICATNSVLSFVLHYLSLASIIIQNWVMERFLIFRPSSSIIANQ